MSLIVLAINFLLLSLSTQNKDFVSPTTYFYFVIFLMGISSASIAYLNGDMFRISAQMSPKYSQAIMR